MFFVNRDPQAPNSLSKTIKDYRTEEVITKLNKMFFGKCYLCEKDNISDIEVEHLIPHKNNENLKYDWNNLFYSCSRCNSIKGIKEKILDCTNIDVSKAIELRCPSSDSDPVIVNLGLFGESEEILATKELLEECYNNRSTAIRGISRQALLDEIIEKYALWLDLKIQLRKNLLSTREEEEVLEKLKKMCQPNYPFSAFWKWHIYRDNFLKDKISIFDEQ